MRVESAGLARRVGSASCRQSHVYNFCRPRRFGRRGAGQAASYEPVDLDPDRDLGRKGSPAAAGSGRHTARRRGRRSRSSCRVARPSIVDQRQPSTWHTATSGLPPRLSTLREPARVITQAHPALGVDRRADGYDVRPAVGPQRGRLHRCRSVQKSLQGLRKGVPPGDEARSRGERRASLPGDEQDHRNRTDQGGRRPSRRTRESPSRPTAIQTRPQVLARWRRPSGRRTHGQPGAAHQHQHDRDHRTDLGDRPAHADVHGEGGRRCWRRWPPRPSPGRARRCRRRPAGPRALAQAAARGGDQRDQGREQREDHHDADQIQPAWVTSSRVALSTIDAAASQPVARARSSAAFPGATATRCTPRARRR